MTIQTDFEDRFPSIPWQPGIESVWPSYTCLPYNDANKEAILNLIAHLITLDSSPGSSPAAEVTSKTVGSVSVGYGSRTGYISDASVFYNSTKYGQRFWMLTASKISAAFV